jgi:cytidylate kinase
VTAPLVVAIDGPSGSGKSSTARGVAQKLGLAFLDTGAMYRAATWLVLHSEVAADDTAAVAALVESADITVELDPSSPVVAINGTDVTEAIREPVVSAAVSSVATNLDVRANLVARQQEIIASARQGIVAEGRDITTVVAPEAPVRVLLV